MKKSSVAVIPGTILFVIATLVGFRVLGKSVPNDTKVSAKTAQDILKTVGRLNGEDVDPCRFPSSPAE